VQINNLLVFLAAVMNTNICQIKSFPKETLQLIAEDVTQIHKELYSYYGRKESNASLIKKVNTLTECTFSPRLSKYLTQNHQELLYNLR